MDIDENVTLHSLCVFSPLKLSPNPLLQNKGCSKQQVEKKDSDIFLELPTERIVRGTFSLAKLYKNNGIPFIKQVVKVGTDRCNEYRCSSQPYIKDSFRVSKVLTNSIFTIERSDSHTNNERSGKYNMLKEEYRVKGDDMDLFKQELYKADFVFVLQPGVHKSAEAYKKNVTELCKSNSSNYPRNHSRFPSKKTVCIELQDILMGMSTFPEQSDIQIPIYIGEMLIGELYVKLRPFLFEFLADISSKYELILYSSLNRAYVDSILANISGLENYFAYIFGDDHCVFANLDYSVKCLDFLLETRSLADILFVDKTLKSLPHFPYNFMPAPLYSKDDPDDKGLAKISVGIDRIMTQKTVQEGVHGCL
jgi:hypothetical protein